MIDGRQDLLRQFGDVLVKEVKPLAKRFADSVVAETTPTSLAIQASEFISTLVEGRRPTSPNAVKGDPTLQELLLDWINVEGIKPRESGMTQEALSWAMATSMHKHGDLLFQRGGGPNIFAKVLDENRLNSFASLVGDNEKRVLAESTFRQI